MKRGSTATTMLALLLVLLLVASPALGGEPKGGSGEQTQVRSGAAQGNGDTSDGVPGGVGDTTRDRAQTRVQDQTCDPECDGDGLTTQTRTQTRAQIRTSTRATEGSEDATQTRIRTRTQYMLESGLPSGTVDPEPQDAVIEETQTAKQAGGLLGDVLQTMTRLAERVFLWLGMA